MRQGRGDDHRVPEARGLTVAAGAHGRVSAPRRVVPDSLAEAVKGSLAREKEPCKAPRASIPPVETRDQESHGLPGQASDRRGGATKELEKNRGEKHVPKKLSTLVSRAGRERKQSSVGREAKNEEAPAFVPGRLAHLARPVV